MRLRWYTGKVKIALAQINPTVGDFTGNAQLILDFTRRAAAAGADLVVFPELATTGYPPADLLEKTSFLNRSYEVIEEIATAAAGLSVAVICGFVAPAPAGSGKNVQNAAALLREGRVDFVQTKRLLPFYDVFDEQRYFAPAAEQRLFDMAGERVALTICEDAWNDKNFWETRRYGIDPIEDLMHQGGDRPPTLILNISASPYWKDKRATREQMLAAIARRYAVPVLMVNQVGGNDSLIFDGSSLGIGRDGVVAAQALSAEEDLIFYDTATGVGDMHVQIADETAMTYAALVLGTRDYVRKCGFKKVLVGLSGGIDSALVAAIAADALGAGNVTGIGMPSPYSSSGSVGDSRALAANLGIGFELLPISHIFTDTTEVLSGLFAGLAPDLTEENLQARIRGNLLMALSNKFNSLVLTTGNKSEMATGYCTLYGDMVGALAVIGDVLKTRVYDLCRFVNREREIIPVAILDKPPSAELRPGQLDSDSLLDYAHLDPVVAAYVERYETPEQIAEATGLGLEVVRSVVKMIERSEYKRQQAAPVLKVTPKAFGLGRRFPIAVKVQV
jgi:NAD+ synthase/NAD+ synthase (glutamine-hydrolysing)